VGSSFDAYVKAYLYKELVNKGDPKYEFEALFKEQVEEHNRGDQMVAGRLCNARKDGEEVWKAYQKVGGLNDLMKDMTNCV
ncbi:hypothetical protein, partial [Pseudomonas urmiensis]|uniref:hypothetical protein n=1 Tax=Pseudomonas urmiensis TaxID=2745493 RepID=UPI0034D7AC91